MVGSDRAACAEDWMEVAGRRHGLGQPRRRLISFFMVIVLK